MPETPRFLYFDLGKVLFNFDHSRVCEQLAEVAGLPLGDMQAFFTEHDFHIQLETGEITPEKAYEEFCTRLKVSPSFEEVMFAASDIFWINAPIVSLVSRLFMANIPMAILSNTSYPHWSFLEQQKFPLLSMFRFAALSYELKAMKPALSIYKSAEEMADASGKEIFFTDDRQENIDGAREAGWQAELFVSASQLEKDLRARGVEFS
jgi:FMN phosphatase YigB (HAD superfamily)